MGWSREVALFPLDRELQSTEKRCPNLAQDLPALLFLAWGSRQSDGRRAQSLATQALAQLQDSTRLTGVEAGHARARMTLVLAEVSLHMMRLDEAQTRLDQARAEFEALADGRGLADVHWLMHYIHFDRGQIDAMRDALAAAVDAAESLGDADRALLFRATLARSDLFRDVDLARMTWSEQFPYDTAGLSAPCAAAVADFRGLECGLTSDYASAVPFFVTAFERAIETGQVRRAIAVASNLGFNFTSMSDYKTAIGWLKKGLEIARRVRWPGAIGLCLAQTGEAQRRVGQIESARAMLRECLQIMKDQPGSRTMMLALHYLGQTELDLGNYAEALEHFESLARCDGYAQSMDMRCEAELGRARALMHLGRVDEARAVALADVDLAAGKQQRNALVDLYWVLADIEQRSGSGMERVIGWYDKALEQARAMKGYLPPPRLLDEAAKAHAQAGRHADAYRLATWAGEVRQKVFSEETSMRATALNARHQLEAERTEREQARRQTAAESERLKALNGMQAVLVKLGSLALDVQACASIVQLQSLMEAQLSSLLRATAWALYWHDDKQAASPAAAAACRVVFTSAQPLPDEALGWSECSLAAQSWRDGAQIVVQGVGPQGLPLMAAPLAAAGQRKGVLVLAGVAGAAFGEQDQTVLRCVCAQVSLLLDGLQP